MEGNQNFGEIFNIMMSEPMNKLCIDCKKPYPLFASINNAVFLCEACSNEHQQLGIQISFIRGLKDEWDEYLLLYMARGGNSRFLNALSSYEIDDEDSKSKYKTEGIQNYRLRLRSEILAEEPPEPIGKIQAKLPAKDLSYIPYPEFEDYKLMSEYTNTTKKNRFFEKVGSFFDKVGKGVKDFGEKLGEKMKEYQIGEKLKKTGNHAFVVIKNAGGYVVMKSKPVVEKISETTKEGYGSLKEKTKQIYHDIKDKITGRPTEKDNEKGEIPISNYYELNCNKTINDFIENREDFNDYNQKDEKQTVNNEEEISLADMGETGNSIVSPRSSSFNLLNNSEHDINSFKDNQNTLPTYQEIQKQNPNI